MRTRRILQDAFVVTLANTLSAGLGALAIVVTVRSLHVDDWAIAAIVVSVGPLISLALSLGTVTHSVRELSRITSCIDRRASFANFIGRRTSLATILALGAIAFWVAKLPTIATCLALGAARYWRGGATVMLSAERQFVRQSVVIVAEKVATLVIVIALTSWDPDVLSLPIAQISGALISSMVAFAYSTRAMMIKPFWAGLRSPHKIWKGSGYFGATSLATAVQQLDVSVVAAVASPYQAGLFAAAARIPSSLNVLGSALALVILPNAARSGERSTRRFQRNYVALGVVAATVLTGVLLYAASWWVPLLLGPGYHAAVGVVRVYLLAVLLGILIQPSVAFLQARGEDKIAARIAVSQVLTALTLQAFGAFRSGALGAAVGFLLSSAAAAGILILRMRRNLKRGINET